MQAIVHFHRLAAQEYRKAWKWYAERSERTAERFRLAVKAAVGRIASEGDALPILTCRYRWVRVKKFPYILIFRKRTNDEMFIVAVAHTSQRPGYWRRRS